MNYLRISWWNDHDLGDILYQDGFRNVMYLDVEVEKPEYNTTIESDLNGDNVEIARLRKEEKVYRFELWGQEDLTDAFAFMQIHDNIEVTLQTGEVLQVAKHGLRADISWEEIGCLAKISVSFTENYILAGNCDENKDAGCYCDVSAGNIDYFDEYPGTTGSNLDIALLWTVENIADKKYTGHLYQFTNNGYIWVLLPDPEQYACYTKLSGTPDTVWMYDGQFWHVFPGYIIALTNPAGTSVMVTGWVVPGAFVTVEFNLNGGGWTSAGDYTADELDTGITFDAGGAGTVVVRIAVWNHSCDYGDTLTEQIII